MIQLLRQLHDDDGPASIHCSPLRLNLADTFVTLLSKRFIRAENAYIRDIQGHIVTKIKKLAAAHHCMRYIQPDADITVRQDCAVFNDSAVINMAVALDTATARNDGVFAQFRATPYISGSHNAGALVDVRIL